MVTNPINNSAALRFRKLRPAGVQNHNPIDKVDLRGGPPDDLPPNRPGGGKKLMWTGVLAGGVLGLTALAGGFSPFVQVQHVHQAQPTGCEAQPTAGQPYAVELVCRDVEPSVRSFGRAHVTVQTLQGQETKILDDGNVATHRYSFDEIRTFDGKVLYTTGGNVMRHSDFLLRGQSDLQSFGRIQPAGRAGEYVSFVASEGNSVAGATHDLATFNMKTGQRAELSELLRAEDYQAVIQAVRGAVHPEGYEGIDLTAETVNRNFALFKEAGELKLSVMLPSEQNGKVTELVMSLPERAVELQSGR